MEDCIFCKIRDRKIAKEFVYEDEDVMVFPDIHPLKPTHLLVVPKVHIEDFAQFNEQALMTKVKTVLNKMIAEKLQNVKSENDMVLIVLKVFQDMFDNNLAGEKEKYKDIAKNIWNLMEKLKKS